jgi:hypothetical protein
MHMMITTHWHARLQGHSMVSANGFFWLFGGLGIDGAYMGDLHSMSTSTYLWKSRGVAANSGGPSARAHHAAATWQKLMFVHGGRDNTSALNDLFMLEVATSPPRWTEFGSLRDAPSPRCHHVAAVATKADDAAALLYVFGGMGVDGSLLGDLYELDVSALQWRNLATAAGAPSARRLHTLVPLPPSCVCFCLCVCFAFERIRL